MSRTTRENVAPLMPRLVASPSVSSPGFPEETRPALLEAHEALVSLFREAGVEKLVSQAPYQHACYAAQRLRPSLAAW